MQDYEIVHDVKVCNRRTEKQKQNSHFTRGYGNRLTLTITIQSLTWIPFNVNH